MTRQDNHLPVEILLEIFDIYRQLHELQPNYEKVWNSRDGWFKLAHVCVHWRHLVFSSSSRLHVHLLFTPCRSSKEPVLNGLPRFPILIDYRTGSWDTEKKENIGIAAIGHHSSRVRGIAFRSPCWSRIVGALGHPFPQLENFTIESNSCGDARLGKAIQLPIRVVEILLGSATSLRRLTLQDVVLKRLFPLLSSVTWLEELALNVWVTRGTNPVFLLANLQRMSSLCRLELMLTWNDRIDDTFPNPPLPAGATDIATLPRLTDFIFTGHSSYLKILAIGLVAPSLQHLDAEYLGPDVTSPLPQLCKFVNDSECQFKSIRLDLSKGNVKLCAETYSKSDHAQPSRIIIPKPFPWENIGHMLSRPLSTVEKLVVTVGSDVPEHTQKQYFHIHWCGLFDHTPQMRFVQVHHPVARGVARALRGPLDGQGPALHILPSLEQVEVQFPPHILESARNMPNGPYAPIRNAFEPLIAARQQVGRPIILNLSQDLSGN